MEVALHHGAGPAFEHHRDRAGRGLVRVGDRLDRVARYVEVERLGGRLDALEIADQDRLDQAAIGRKHRAAQRIVIVGADDGGFQRRQLGGPGDKHAEMVGRIDDQRRQVARLDDLGDGRRLDLGGSGAHHLPDGVDDPGVEYGDRLPRASRGRRP